MDLTPLFPPASAAPSSLGIPGSRWLATVFHVVQLLLAAAIACAVPAQTWVQVTSNGPLAEASLAFDTLHGQAVVTVVDGSYFKEYLYDSATRSWSYNGTVPMNQRTLAAMTYDSVRDRIVLFGGRDTGFSVALDDTWERNGTTGTWTHVVTPQSPPARDTAAIAFDAARNRIVCFGGQRYNPSPFTLLNDTWEYDGVTWSPVITPAVPPAGPATMTYDSSRGRMILCVGVETWEYDGSVPSWTSVATVPSSGSGAIAYDPGRNRCVMCSSVDTLEYTAATSQWTRVTGDPVGAGFGPGPDFMYYDPARARCVLQPRAGRGEPADRAAGSREHQARRPSTNVAH